MRPRALVILDNDNSTDIPARDVDDGLMIALASPEFGTPGITARNGDCRTFQSTYTTLRRLDLAGRGDITVATGRENPLRRDVAARVQPANRGPMPTNEAFMLGRITSGVATGPAGA